MTDNGNKSSQYRANNMKIELKIFLTKRPTAEGYPLAFEIVHSLNSKETKRRLEIGKCHPEHFLPSEKNISRKHPDFDLLEPIIKQYKAKARTIILHRVTDVEVARRMLEETVSGKLEASLPEFASNLIKDMEAVAVAVLKRNEKEGNKKLGNIDVYKNAVQQFTDYHPGIRFSEIDYVTLMKFRSFQEALGNSKATINLYLRTIRSVYNKGILHLKVPPPPNPFTGVFKGLAVKSYANKKKYIDKDTLLLLERLPLEGAKARSRDLWLLQFYLGGSDLIDIYHLEKANLRKGRVYFSRSKGAGDLLIDLAIHPKALRIIDRYREAEGRYIFPWRKDRAGYVGFRRNLGADLKRIQEDASIEVLPVGGILAIKVARHTFQNIAKKKRLDPDLIRELVGHERDDVDNFYKDRFDAQTRDAGHYEVISSFDCINDSHPYERLK